MSWEVNGMFDPTQGKTGLDLIAPWDERPAPDAEAVKRLVAASQGVLSGFIGALKDLHAPVETNSYIIAYRAAASSFIAGEKPKEQPQPTPGIKPFSVLLAYPDYMDIDETAHYYAHVYAADSIAAIAEAQREAVAAQVDQDDINPVDFVPLLVTAGHNSGLATVA